MTGRLVVLLLLLLKTAFAQWNAGPEALAERVTVRVVFANDARCDPSLRIALIRSVGFTFGETSVDSQCIAEFSNVPAGNYRVKLIGASGAKVDERDFAVGPGGTHEVEVRATRAGGPEAVEGYARTAFVSVSDLRVPSNAEKEFDKANHLLSKQDWAKATERLRKAIAIYPGYAAAYNNLGAAYSRMGDNAQAREALEKAITLDDHLAMAYVNLARVSFSTRDFSGVETSIGKAMSLAAPDTNVLTLLACAQLEDRHFDQAVEASRLAHRSQMSHHAFLHLVAARAADLEGKRDDAIDELQRFLSEEPSGPRAERARNALATLQAQASAR